MISHENAWKFGWPCCWLLSPFCCLHHKHCIGHYKMGHGMLFQTVASVWWQVSWTAARFHKLGTTVLCKTSHTLCTSFFIERERYIYTYIYIHVCVQMCLIFMYIYVYTYIPVKSHRCGEASICRSFYWCFPMARFSLRSCVAAQILSLISVEL